MSAEWKTATPRWYFSHHKCATMYAHAILERVCSELGLRQRTVYGWGDFGENLADFARREDADLIAYLDARWSDVRPLKDVVGVHVIRDPRDVLVSAYFSHLRTHSDDKWPELTAHREKLKACSKEQGLFLEMGFSAYVFESINAWEYGRDGMLELRFEELVADPYRFWIRAANHLALLSEEDFGMRKQLAYSVAAILNQAANKYAWWPVRRQLPQIPGGRLLGIVYDNRFSKKAGGRSPGVEDPGSHYRKGQAGDWAKHLNQEHLQEFGSRFPGLLARTGYV
jgi:uncharacterized protein YbdZ (MbtH family)